MHNPRNEDRYGIGDEPDRSSRPHGDRSSTTAHAEPTEGTHSAEVISTSERTVHIGIGTAGQHIERRIIKAELPSAYHTPGYQFEVEMRAGQIIRIRSSSTESWTRLQ